MEMAPAAAPLVPSEARTLARAGGCSPTLAWDRRSGTAYLAWPQEVPGPAHYRKDKGGKKADATIEVRVAPPLRRWGRSFGAPVVASSPEDRVESYAVSPTQVAVGPRGEGYVLYSHHDPEFRPAGWEWGRSVLRLVRSEDGGKRFSASVEIGAESVEGAHERRHAQPLRRRQRRSLHLLPRLFKPRLHVSTGAARAAPAYRPSPRRGGQDSHSLKRNGATAIAMSFDPIP